jgi:hypothetical protein
MASLPKRLWAWLVGPRKQTAFDARDEPMTRRERQREMLDSAEHPLDDHPSGDWARQQPFQ